MRGYPFVSPIKESQEKKVTDKEQEKNHLYVKLGFFMAYSKLNNTIFTVAIII